MNRTGRSPVYFMALTIFIDFAGFGIVLPLLPFWAERLGAGAVGVGLILTIYALAQFIFTPVLGSCRSRADSYDIRTGAVHLYASAGNPF